MSLPNGAASVTTTQPSVTVTVSSTSSVTAQGSLTVQVNASCGTNRNSRTFQLYRTPAPSNITGNTGICVNRTNTFTAPGGGSYSWSVTPTSTFSVSSYGLTADVRALTTGGGVLSVTYNRPCDNARVTASTGINGFNCGGRLATEPDTAPMQVLTIYPNPVGDRLRVDFGGPEEGESVVIYNSLQQLVARGELKNGTCELNTYHLAQGLYVVHVLNRRGVIARSRLVK